jgi:DNA replication protein DnaC
MKESTLPLKQLGLTQLELVLPQLLEQARREQWTSETVLARALGAEIEGRDRRANERRLKAAHIPGEKTLDSFDFPFQPSLSERLVRELADLSFVRAATNVVFLGPPGVGKTHLSLALAGRALKAGHMVLFTTLRELAETLDSASHPGLVRQRLRRYITPSLLVIDEVGYTKLSLEQARHFFELVAARYEHGSIVLTSNTSFAGWGSILGGDEVLATALLDRLLHHAEVIPINGPSYRMKERQLDPAQSRSRKGALSTSALPEPLGPQEIGSPSSAQGSQDTGSLSPALALGLQDTGSPPSVPRSRKAGASSLVLGSRKAGALSPAPGS